MCVEECLLEDISCYRYLSQCNVCVEECLLEDISCYRYLSQCNVCVEECLLEDISCYRYLSQGNVTVLSGDDDVELYRQVTEAMDVLGFTKDDQMCTSLV